MAGKEVRAGKAFVEITLRDKLQAGLKRAASQLRAFASVTSAVGAGLTGASAAILGPLAAAVKQFSDAGDAVQKMAARTGLSAEAVSELGHAANLSGTNVATLETGVRRMQQTVADADSGLVSAEEGLARLGLSAQELIGLSPDAQLSKIADRIAAIRDPAFRTAAAMDVFGKSGTQLLPMLAGGSAGIEAMREQARALGLTISTDAANSAAALNDALGTMWSTVKGLTINIGAALAPVVTDAANRISAAVASVTKFIQRNQRLVVIVASVAAGIGLAGAALLTIGGIAAAAGLALSGLASVVGLIGPAVAAVGAAIAALLSPVGLLITGVSAAAAAWLYFSGVGSRAIQWIKERFGELLAIVQQVAGGMGAALMAGNLELAARILWAGLKTLWYTGVGQLNQTWNALLASAQGVWTKIAELAGGAATVVANIWSQLPQWLTGPLESAGQTVGAALGWIGQQYSGLVGWATESFSAIARAITHGEFALAGEIAWNTIKLAFAEGITWATTAWSEFTTGLASLWDQAVTTIRQVWNNVSNWIAGQILKLVGTIQSTLAALAEIDPTGLAEKLKASVAVDVEGALRVLAEDGQRANQQLEQSRTQRDSQRAAELQQRMAANEQRLAELQAARDASLAKASALDTNTSAPQDSPLATAKAELADALAEAAQSKSLFDVSGLSDSLQTSLGDVSGRLEDSSKLSSQGTFSAAAARGLGAGGLQERQLKATEQVAQNTKELLNRARRGQLAFE